MKKQTLGRLIGIATLLISMWVLYQVVGDSYREIPSVITTGVILACAVGIVGHGCANAILAHSWGLLLSALGHTLPNRTVAWIWTRAQLARYVVGSAGLVGRPLLAKSHGVPLSVGTSTTLIESVWLMAIMSLGIPTTVVLLPASTPRWLPYLVFTGSLIFVLAVTLFPRLTLKPLQFLKGHVQLDGLNPWFGMQLTGNYLVQLAIRTAVFVLLGFALAEPGQFSLYGLIAAFIMSSLVGWLFIFSPGGLGPREAVASIMITHSGMTGTQAVALVVLARLVEVVGELAYVAVVRE